MTRPFRDPLNTLTRLALAALAALLALVAQPAHAAKPAASAGARSAASAKPATPGERRSTQLSFEDGIIEDVSRPGLDSLDMSANQPNGSDAILYMKRKDFRVEIRQALDELRYTP